MKLMLAFLIVCVASIAVFGALSLFGVADKVAGPIAGALLAATTYVHQSLEKGKPTLSAWPKGIVGLRGFFLPRWTMLVYGVLLMFSWITFIILLFRSAFDITKADLSAPAPFFMLTMLPVTGVGVYMIARWIGSRTSRHAIVVALLAAVVARGLLLVVDVFLFTTATGRGVMQPEFLEIWNKYDYTKIIWLALVGTLMFPGMATLGAWRGSRFRLAGYFRYLLSRLPRETRVVIVNLAYEEASKLAAISEKDRHFIEI